MTPDDVGKADGSPSLHSVSQFEIENGSSSAIHETKSQSKFQRRYQKWAARIKCFEMRGIEPIPLEERQPVTRSTSLHMLLMWFSMSLATNNIIVGSMGTLVLGLRFKDAAICAIFGNLFGTATVGYMSTWGPRSGTRTLIVTRYFMGYYPSKVCCALNVFTNVGYSMVNCVVGGQILSKVSGGHISVLVGIVLVAAISWVMAMFGMRIFHLYERYAWLPQLMVLCVMLGSAGPHFDFQIHDATTPERLAAKRITFFSFCFTVALAWAPLAADYYVYYTPDAKSWKTFLMTVLGSAQAMIFTLLMGIGLGTVVASSPTHAASYGGSPGDLLMTAYEMLGGFGKFCAVINVLALVANNTPGAYSMGINFQMLGSMWQRVPRPVFTTLSTVLYAACAMGGRNSLYDVFKGFLPLIGYWVGIWFTIVLEEDLLFRRHRGYDWSAWDSRAKLPLGFAAGIAFLVGWGGAVVGMDQDFYAGPIARIAGGADLGLWLATACTALSFPPLRCLELWLIGR